MAVHRKFPSRFAALAILAGLGIAFVRCSTPAIDPNAHTWGAYTACLRRLSDQCRARDLDGGCRTEAVDSKALTVGVRPDGTFLWARDGLAALEGRQVGTRFEIVRREADVATICGCAADVTETIRGELVAARGTAADCTAADPLLGCNEASPATAFDGGLPGDGWLEGADGGVDVEADYEAMRAVVVDEAVSVDGGACACLPCRVVFEVSGNR